MTAFVETRAGRLEARRLGTTTDPTLVFLHEGLGCVNLWKDWPDQLVAGSGLGGFVFSRQGYGRSVRREPPWPVSYLDDEGELLADVLDAAGIERAILVGHSDGGSIALAAAAGDHDGRIAGLALYAAHVNVEPENVSSIGETVQRYEHTDLRARLARHHEDVDATFLGWSGAWTDPEFARWSLAARLAAVTVPVLVVQGRADPYGSVAQATTIAAGVSGPVGVELLAECGHAPHQDRPERTRSATLALVRRARSAL